MNEREALKLALEALERSVATCFDRYAHQQVMSQPDHFINQTIAVINESLAQPEQEKTMSITDDNGNAIQHQYRVIEQRGNWFLVYDQHQVGNTVVHEFRIQKLKHDILLYAGITLEEAKKRFAEKVEADNE